MTENRGQRKENRGQKTNNRSQITDDRRRITEGRTPVTEGFNFGIRNEECRRGAHGVGHRSMEDRRIKRVADL